VSLSGSTMFYIFYRKCLQSVSEVLAKCLQSIYKVLAKCFFAKGSIDMLHVVLLLWCLTKLRKANRWQEDTGFGGERGEIIGGNQNVLIRTEKLLVIGEVEKCIGAIQVPTVGKKLSRNWRRGDDFFTVCMVPLRFSFSPMRGI
jgi:hypothetical protein